MTRYGRPYRIEFVVVGSKRRNAAVPNFPLEQISADLIVQAFVFSADVVSRSEIPEKQYGIIEASRPARPECLQARWKSCNRNRYVPISQQLPTDHAKDEGGARGIGLEVSKGLAEAGANVGLEN